MVEAIKMAARVAVLAIVAAGVLNVVGVAIGLISGSLGGIEIIYQGVGIAKAMIEHWFGPSANILIGLGIGTLTLEMSLMVLKGLLFAQKIILKVNEG